LPDGGRAVLAGGVLNENTTLLGLAFPGGQCLLRTPITGEMEERFTGRRLKADEPLLQIWRHEVDNMAQLKRILDHRCRRTSG
jgi:hypothetical protein